MRGKLFEDLDRRQIALLFVLPIIYVALILWLRQTAGSFSNWYSIDPNIRYLLDALNLLALDAVGNVDHPGATVQWIGALVIKLLNPFTETNLIVDQALMDSDGFLMPILVVLTLVTALAMILAGAAAFAATGSLIPVVLVQLSPFLSRILVKNALDVKPVPLLVAMVLLTAAVVFLALRSNLMERHKTAYAWAFGLIGGFSVATKITAAPILILPVFLLWGVRPLFHYGLACAIGFVMFALPTVFQFEQFAGWIFKVAMGSGAYGGGAVTVIDFDAYPKSLYKLLSRPITFVPLIAAVTAIVVARWRRNKVSDYPALEVKALGGVALAQFAQIALVAKHPSAHYIVSALALSGLSLGLTYLVFRRLELWSENARNWSFKIFVFLIFALMVSRVPSAMKVYREMATKNEQALALDESRFDQCLKIYGLFASNQSFAMIYGNFLVQESFSDRLAKLLPENDVAYFGYRGEARQAAGVVDTAMLAKNFSCFYGRVSHEHGGADAVAAVLRRSVPGIQLNDSCSNRYEKVFTAGVDCQGRRLD